MSPLLKESFKNNATKIPWLYVAQAIYINNKPLPPSTCAAEALAEALGGGL